MKKYLAIILIIVSFTGLSAKHSDDFLIGDYSNINHDEYHNVAKETGFNTVRLKTYTNQVQNPLFDKYLSFDKINQLDYDGIDVVVWDNGYWNNGVGDSTSFNPYSPYVQSLSNKMVFKTNYSVKNADSPTELSGKPDWFYGFKYDQALLNSSTIQILGEDGILCIPSSDRESYTVFKDLYIRENMAYLSPSTTSCKDRLIFPFMIDFKSGLNEYLYITFKMGINRITTNSDSICKVGLKVAVDYNPGPSGGTSLYWDYDLSKLLEPEDSEIQGLVLFQNDFSEDENNLYKEFTYKLKLDLDYIDNHIVANKPQDINQNLDFIKLSVRDNRILYVSPTLEFYCNSATRLYVKSVEFKDQVIKNWEEPEYAVNDSIKARINAFNESNIIGFDTYDEPLPAQFEAVKKLNELLTQNSSSHSDYTFKTAITDYGFNYNNIDQTYSLLNHFKSHTKNKILSPDPYLYGNNTAWYNNSSVSDSMHIQYITDKISQSYKKARLLATDGHKFIPIVQAFGDWSGNGANWKTIMIPPTAQQKMLMYLPLCYDPDGIWIFKLTSESLVDSINSGDHHIITPLHFNYAETIETLFAGQYQAIKEAINKINRIHPLLSKCTWDSLGTNTLFPTFTNFNNIRIKVQEHSPSAIRNSPNYCGYVEYGSYIPSQNFLEGTEQFMFFVNRRTNYDTGNTNDRFNVDSRYETANSQKIIVDCEDLPESWRVFNVLTDEIYDIINNKASIEIEAGDGILVKFGQRYDNIPENETYTIADEAINYDIYNKGNIIIGNNVTFLNNKKIYNDSTGTITINSLDLRREINSECEYTDYFIENHGDIIISNSNFNLKSHFIKSTGNSSITVTGSEINAGNFINYSEGITNITINNSIIKSEIDSTYIISYCHDANLYDIPIAQISINNSTLIGNKRNNGIKHSSTSESSTFSLIFTAINNFKKGVQYYAIRNEAVGGINSCYFNYNNIGLQIDGRGKLATIKNSSFYMNSLGIVKNWSKTKILECTFSYDENSSNSTGIKLVNNLSNRDLGTPGDELQARILEIQDCTFNYANIAIDIYNSSPYMRNNYFNSVKNICVSDNSRPDLSFNARNNFNNQNNFNSQEHIIINQNDSSVKLRNGYNNFYTANHHFKFMSSGLFSAPEIIDCTNNYVFLTNNLCCPDSYYQYFITYGILTEPIVDGDPDYPEFILIQAKNLQDLGEFTQALMLYQSILLNPVENEFKYWPECIDETFITTEYMKGDFSELRLFYECLKNNLPIFLEEEQVLYIKSILTDYIKKCYIMDNDFVSAKAILQSRIENSDDEIDQLLAGINLDNVELLETLTESESKAPLNLKIKQTKIMTIDKQKQEKFDRLNKLLKGISDSDVPAVENILYTNNYPNPFNPTTTIMFNLPKDSKVEINIYNIKGQKVKSLVSDDFIAGKHKLIWNGTNNFDKKVSSGIYFYRLKTNQGIINKKMLLLK